MDTALAMRSMEMLTKEMVRLIDQRDRLLDALQTMQRVYGGNGCCTDRRCTICRKVDEAIRIAEGR